MFITITLGSYRVTTAKETHKKRLCGQIQALSPSLLMALLWLSFAGWNNGRCYVMDAFSPLVLGVTWLRHVSSAVQTLIYVLKLSRRQNSMTVSQADSRVTRYIKSDVSDTDFIHRQGNGMTPHFICPVCILMDGLDRMCERANRCRWAEFEDCCNLIGCQVQFAVVLVCVARSG